MIKKHFEKGKWYKGNDGSFRKCREDSPLGRLPYSDGIFRSALTNSFSRNFLNGDAIWDKVVEANLYEIQKYLPDGHEDKTHEFVECISVSDYYQHYTVGKIYKVLGEHILDNEGKQGAYSKNRSISQFKPSTKETFDKQNMKDEFVIPKQWHINVTTKEQAKVVGRWFDQSEFACPQTSNFYEKEGDLGIYGGVSSGNVFGNEVGTEITFEQFEKYILKQNNMEKEIIGYKSPMQIGSIPKGTLYTMYGVHLYIPSQTTTTLYSVPKEIVETWEAVYKEDQTKTLVLGTGIIKIVIGNGVVVVDGENVIIYKDLVNAYKIMTGNIASICGSRNSYTVSFPKGVRIGCSEFEVSEIKQIIDTYNELNK